MTSIRESPWVFIYTMMKSKELSVALQQRNKMADPIQLQGNSKVSENCSAGSEGGMNQLMSRWVSVALKHIFRAAIIQTRDNDLKSVFEDLHRSIIEKVERSKRLIVERNTEDETHTSNPRILRLNFLQKIASPVFTGIELKGEGGNTLTVALVDDNTGQIVVSGPEASAQVDVVILKGDFDDDDDDGWTTQDFNNNTVRERDHVSNGRRLPNKSLLTEDVQLKLNKGIGVVHELRFKHTSTHMNITNFRLGARASATFDGIQILEAKTESFTLKDRRNLRNQKRDPPSASDFVWRLVKIDRRGKNWMKLKQQKVNTVKDFLLQLLRDPQQLNNMLCLRPTEFENTVNHARRCIPDNHMLFYSDSQQNAGLVFDIFGDFHGLVLAWKFVPIGSMSENDKAKAQELFLSAQKQWGKVVEFNDMESLQQHLTQSVASDRPRLHQGPSRRDNGVDNISEMVQNLQSNEEGPIISGACGATAAEDILGTSSYDVPNIFSPGEYQDHRTFLSSLRGEMMPSHLLPEPIANADWNTTFWGGD